MRRAVRSGQWILTAGGGVVNAKSKFQRERLTEAATAARIYLEGNWNTAQMAMRLGGFTAERAAQIIRLGVKALIQEGQLQPAAVVAPTPTLCSSPSGSGRGPC